MGQCIPLPGPCQPLGPQLPHPHAATSALPQGRPNGELWWMSSPQLIRVWILMRHGPRQAVLCKLQHPRKSCCSHTSCWGRILLDHRTWSSDLPGGARRPCRIPSFVPRAHGGTHPYPHRARAEFTPDAVPLCSGPLTQRWAQQEGWHNSTMLPPPGLPPPPQSRLSLSPFPLLPFGGWLQSFTYSSSVRFMSTIPFYFDG